MEHIQVHASRTAELSSLHARMKTFMYAHEFLRIQWLIAQTINKLVKLVTNNRTHTTHSPVGFCHRTHCTCPGLISGTCRLDFECSPSTPETPAYTDTQAGLAGAWYCQYWIHASTGWPLCGQFYSLHPKMFLIQFAQRIFLIECSTSTT